MSFYFISITHSVIVTLMEHNSFNIADYMLIFLRISNCSTNYFFLNRRQRIVCRCFNSISVAAFEFTTFAEVAEIKSPNAVEPRQRQMSKNVKSTVPTTLFLDPFVSLQSCPHVSDFFLNLQLYFSSSVAGACVLSSSDKS